jgi:hypothetical protein
VHTGQMIQHSPEVQSPAEIWRKVSVPVTTKPLLIPNPPSLIVWDGVGVNYGLYG